MAKMGQEEHQRRRRDIFVETHRQEFQAPAGATSSAYATPDGALSFLWMAFYNYAAPLALSPERGSVARRQDIVARA